MSKGLGWGALALTSLGVAAWLGGVLFLAFTGVAHVTAARPWTLYSYYYWYGSNPKIEAWIYVSGVLAVFGIGAPIFAWFRPPPETLHGDARWARRVETRKAGLFGDQGIVIGEWGGRLLRHGGTPMVSPHVFLAAPTGSGKTQGVMLPNALTWTGSLVALDLKGELYAASAGFRAQHGQRVYCINFTPRDYRTHHYNPFAFVSSDPNFLVADVQRIASYLVQTGKGDDFWPQEARRLMIALALYCYSEGEIPTLPRLRELALVGADGTGLQRWCKTLAADPARQATLHREAVMSLVNFAHSAENTVAGVVQTLVAGLTPFVNELTAAVVSDNSVDLRKLREEAISVYLVVQPADIEQLSPVIRLFFQQVVDLNTDFEFGQSPKHKHLVLLGMDEFATIGKVPAIQHSIAFIRSYGLRLLTIIQSPAQLQSVYHADGAKSFLDNFGCGVHFTPGAEDLTAAQNLERLLGYKTIEGRAKTVRGALSMGDDQRSETTSDQRRALMLTQEILRMPANRILILISALHPIRANKLFAVRDPRFARRVLPAPQVPRIMLRPLSTPNKSVALVPYPDEAEAREKTLLHDVEDPALDPTARPTPGESVSAGEIDELCDHLLDKLLISADTKRR